MRMSAMKDLTGKRFHKLLVIEIAERTKRGIVWLCQCDCGNTARILGERLNNGTTKSCGCLRLEVARSKARSDKMGNLLRKAPPDISSAIRRWKHYVRDGGDLTFETFYELSQKNCSYCGAEPSIRYNRFLNKDRASVFSRENGFFVHNGLDRVDNSFPHNEDNCVPACEICNRAKNDQSIDAFRPYIDRLIVSECPERIFPMLALPTNRYLLTSIKSVFTTHHRYNDGDLTLQEFYSLTQLSCFYCGADKPNLTNRAKTDKKASQLAKESSDFYYTGIDRLDSTLKHIKGNLVPCCSRCNWAKGDVSFTDFQAWIARIKSFQTKPNFNNSE